MTDYVSEPALGIDLGTTYSCMAIWKNGKPEVIPNQETGNRTTPSIVAFTKKDRIVGEAAKNQAVRNFQNTIYDSKRLIGRDFNDPEVQKNIKLWPFKVIKGNNNRPVIEVEYKGKKEKFYPEEISACILSKMKQLAKEYLGKEVNDAIITCPAYFDDLQRKATQDAGKIAGLNVIRIINEPTAAAIAYGLDKDNQGEKNILIFDLGGGTFDVTVLSMDNNLLEVRSTRGDMHLGGEDFDNKLVEYCIKEFQEKTEIDISNNKKAKIRLKILCEKAKIILSSTQETTIDIDNLADGEDLNLNISRPEFEDLCKELFEKCIPLVEEAIKDARLTKERIKDIVLVGGSTRIPKIQEIVKEYFGKEPTKKIHPDEAVAIGAAIQGAIANNVEDEGLERLILLDVTPLNLGLELNNGEMDVLIKKNTTIPCVKEEKYRTVKDNQKNIKVKVYQGERVLAKGNKFLGECNISNIPPKPKGQVIVTVNFSIDINGSLVVTAKENSGGQESDLKIAMDKSLTPDVIEELIQRAKEMEEDDNKKIEATRAKNKLQDLANKLKSEGSNDAKKKAEEILKWIKRNQDEDKEVYEYKYQELMINLENNSKINYPKEFNYNNKQISKNYNEEYYYSQLSLGFELLSGEMVFMIKRNSLIPCQKLYTYSTEKDNQDKFSI